MPNIQQNSSKFQIIFVLAWFFTRYHLAPLTILSGPWRTQKRCFWKSAAIYHASLHLIRQQTLSNLCFNLPCHFALNSLFNLCRLYQIKRPEIKVTNMFCKSTTISHASLHLILQVTIYRPQLQKVVLSPGTFFFLGGIFLILMRNFPYMEEKFS